MARLAFCNYHNMVAILEKYEHNVDFHQIVDFVEASHSRIETTDEGTKILATVDGKPITIFESSIRRNLKLKDEAGISSLPDAKLFENLALMANNILPNQKFSFQKGQFSHQWKYQSIPLCNGWHYTKRARIAQSSALHTATDEPASPFRDDSQGEACHTVYGLEAEQEGWKWILKKPTKNRQKTTTPNTKWKRSKKTKSIEAESQKSKPGNEVPEFEVEAVLAFTNLVIKSLRNPLSKHLVFEEPELDRQGPDKLVVGKPSVV
nr:hypothetical protein [Tanacetum cinerariifolium]